MTFISTSSQKDIVKTDIIFAFVFFFRVGENSNDQGQMIRIYYLSLDKIRLIRF